MRKSSTKEFTTFAGVKSSFIASVNLAKHTHTLTADAAFRWYVDLLERQGRTITKKTALAYKFELEDAFYDWILKQARKQKAKTTQPVTSNVQAAIDFLEEEGYIVRKKRR